MIFGSEYGTLSTGVFAIMNGRFKATEIKDEMSEEIKIKLRSQKDFGIECENSDNLRLKFNIDSDFLCAFKDVDLEIFFRYKSYNFFKNSKIWLKRYSEDDQVHLLSSYLLYNIKSVERVSALLEQISFGLRKEEISENLQEYVLILWTNFGGCSFKMQTSILNVSLNYIKNCGSYHLCHRLICLFSKIIEKLDDYSLETVRNIWDLSLQILDYDQIFISVKLFLKKFLSSVRTNLDETILNSLLETLISFINCKSDHQRSNLFNLLDIVITILNGRSFEMRRGLMRSLYQLVFNKNIKLPEVLLENLIGILNSKSHSFRNEIDCEIVLRAQSILLYLGNYNVAEPSILYEILSQANCNVLNSHQVLFMELLDLMIKANPDFCANDLNIFLAKIQNVKDEVSSELSSKVPLFYSHENLLGFGDNVRPEKDEKRDYNNILDFLCLMAQSQSDFCFSHILGLLNRTNSISNSQASILLRIMFKNASRLRPVSITEWLLSVHEIEVRGEKYGELTGKVDTSIFASKEEKILFFKVLQKFRLKNHELVRKVLKTSEDLNDLIEFICPDDLETYFHEINLKSLTLKSIRNLFIKAKNGLDDAKLKILIEDLIHRNIESAEEVKIVGRLVLDFLNVVKMSEAKDLEYFLIRFYKLTKSIGNLVKDDKMSSSRMIHEKLLQIIKLFLIKRGAYRSYIVGNLKIKSSMKTGAI